MAIKFNIGRMNHSLPDYSITVKLISLVATVNWVIRAVHNTVVVICRGKDCEEIQMTRMFYGDGHRVVWLSVFANAEACTTKSNQ